MEYTLTNDNIQLTVRSFGAQMISLQDLSGKEILWQGDPQYWNEHAPNLFPYVGRTIDRHYEYNGKTYPMPLHGFACSQDFMLMSKTDDSLTLRLQNNEETEQYFPWKFYFDVTYRLNHNIVEITYTVHNIDDKKMYFGLGGHPGFCVPMEKGEEFSDYRLFFPVPCHPRLVEFDTNGYCHGVKGEYILDESYGIALSYEMFDSVTIGLTETPGVVVLESKLSGKGVKLTYPQMDYLALWHAENTKANFLCIEPWCSLPSPAGPKTVFEEQKDLLQLAPGKVYKNTWSIELI